MFLNYTIINTTLSASNDISTATRIYPLLRDLLSLLTHSLALFTTLVSLSRQLFFSDASPLTLPLST